jgi:hypothetical protein
MMNGSVILIALLILLFTPTANAMDSGCGLSVKCIGIETKSDLDFYAWQALNIGDDDIKIVVDNGLIAPFDEKPGFQRAIGYRKIVAPDASSVFYTKKESGELKLKWTRHPYFVHRLNNSSYRDGKLFIPAVGIDGDMQVNNSRWTITNYSDTAVEIKPDDDFFINFTATRLPDEKSLRLKPNAHIMLYRKRKGAFKIDYESDQNRALSIIVYP